MSFRIEDRIGGSAARQRRLVFVMLGFLLLTRVPAGAARIQPTNLRLEGYVGQAPAGIKPEAHLVLQFEGKNYEFDLVKATVMSGKGSTSRWLQDTKPNRNTVVLRGSTSAVGALSRAASGQKLLIEASYRTGSRDLHVSKLVPVPPDNPAK